MRIESTTVVMPRDIFEDRLMRSKSNRHKWEDQICEGITIADLEEQRIRGGVRLGVERGRMPESSLMETTESLVEKLKLTTNGKLKNAAAVLFLRDTSQFPQFLLRMARFRGNDKIEFIDNQRATIKEHTATSSLCLMLVWRSSSNTFLSVARLWAL